VFPTSLKEGSTGFDSNTFFPAPKKSAGKPATPIMVQKYKGNGTLNLLPIVINNKTMAPVWKHLPTISSPLQNTNANCKDNAMY
jgi:hypothetical protein